MKSWSKLSLMQASKAFGRFSGMVFFCLVPFVFDGAAAQGTQPILRSGVAGMATLSGKVDASKPFKAAQLYIKNVDKGIVYTLFTSGGAYRAVALFPGNYEVDVQATGLESDVQKLKIVDGAHPTLNLSMHASENPDHVPTAGGTELFKMAKLVPYDELFPDEPGKQVAEKVCMTCHGENQFGKLPGNQAVWQARIDYMMGKTIYDRDKTGLGQGLLAPPASVFPFGVQDRKDLLAYMVKNFGPDSERRTVRVTRPLPMDEAVLEKAEFIEYYYPVAGADADAVATRGEGAGGHGRNGSIIGLGTDGNVWSTDSGTPNKLVKLDPRTGKQTDYPTPIPDRGLHDMVIDRQGMVWIGNFSLAGLTSEPMVFMFNPKTEQWKTFDPDPDNQVRTSVKGGFIGMAPDSKGNIWLNWMLPSYFSKLDPKTGKSTFYRVPTNNALPYGLFADKDDKLWFGEWGTGKIAKFDPVTSAFTEYTPPTYPVNVRRGVGGDAQGNVWSGGFSAGKRPGKLFKLDPKTGRFTEWSIPVQGANPYEATADREGNMWFPSDYDDSNQPAFIGSFDPRAQKFRYYPRPQSQAGTNKLEHATNGAVWYEMRNPPIAGFGVLYPDKDHISTLAGYPLNGPPGYPYKLSATGAKPVAASVQ